MVNNSKRSMGVSLVLGAALAIGALAPVYAIAQQAPEQARVTVDFDKAELLSAVQTLMKKTGVQILIDPSAEPFSKVTLHLADVPAEDAIRMICDAAGASFIRDENGVYLLSHKKAGTGGQLVNPPPATGKIIRKRIRVMKANPKAIYDALMSGRGGSGSPFDRSHGTGNTSREALWYGDGRTPYEATFAPPVEATSHPVSMRDIGRANDVILPGDGSGRFGTQGGLGGGQGGFGGGGQGGFGGGQGQGGNAQLTPGQGLVPSGITFISYDPTDNSFIVEGTDEAIQELIRIINEFDEAPRAVTIKVEFVTTSSSVSRSLGFEFNYARGATFAGTTPGSFIRGGDPVFLNYGSGNVASRMRTQLLEGHGKVVDAPVIRTLNNQPAAIFSSVQTTIFINQIVGTGGGSVIVIPQPVPLTVSTGLVVAPRINGDGTITLSLSPQIQDFGQLRRGPNGQEIPDILSQQINVVARVKNDETIVIGGLTRKSDQGSEGRVPVLADLPIVGQFFRSDTKDKNSAELLIFVTPHIIEEGDGGGGE